MNTDAHRSESNTAAPRKLAANRASDLWLLLLAALMPLSIFSAFTASAEVVVGEQAPDFEFEGSDGKTYTLSGLLKAGTGGVVLAFFPKAFTPG